MKGGRQIFADVCGAADTAAAVKSLPPVQWTKLHGYLLRTYDENGVSGKVLGLMLCEGATRYAASVRKGAST